MPIDQKDIPRAHLRGGEQPRHRADYIALDGALQVACSISLVGALLQQELPSFVRYPKLEGVLRSIARARQRNQDHRPPISDLESYLIGAFHRRFNKALLEEQKRLETMELVSATVELEGIESAGDTRWIEELERAITIREITDRMDGWTRKVWQAREYGYSWKEIAAFSGVTEVAAKKRFEYGLEKVRQGIVRRLKRAPRGKAN